MARVLKLKPGETGIEMNIRTRRVVSGYGHPLYIDPKTGLTRARKRGSSVTARSRKRG